MAVAFDKGRQVRVVAMPGGRAPIKRSSSEAPLKLESPSDFAAIERLWWRLLEHTGDIFYVHDVEGRFLAVNPAFYRTTGYSETELSSLNVRDLLTPEDYEENAARITAAVLGERSAVPIEMTIRRKDGSVGYAESVPTVTVAEDGRHLVVGVARDVTARRRADDELREAAAFQATLAEVMLRLHAASTLDALCPLICEQGRRLLGLAAARLFLLRGEELLVVAADGEALSLEGLLQWPLDRPGPLVTALREGKTVVVREKDETLVVLPLSARRGPIGVLVFGEKEVHGCVDDWLQQRAEILASHVAVAVENANLLEDLRRADRLKSDFLSSVSHDLRTPLNVIVGYTDIQLEGLLGPTTAEQHQALRRVRATALGLSSLINATLDLNRLEAGHSLVETIPTNVGALWSDLLAQFEDHPDWGNVTLRWHAEEVPPLMSDPEKLKLILRNLVGNALKFTRAGSIDVTARYLAEDKRLELIVSDTGPGIAPADIPYIFGMFRQGGQARGGVGLGLYLVKRVVDLLGGDLNVTSRLGVGSTFRVSLPATAVA